MALASSTSAGVRTVTASNTWRFRLVCAGEVMQARGASAWVLCGYWGVHWSAAEGRGRLDDGDQEMVVPRSSLT